MDSSRKRKAADAATSGSKRIKLLVQNSNHAPSAVSQSVEDEVQRIGLKLVGMLRKAADKTNRPIADAFLTLPSPEELPEYYDQIKLPIAIDTIEEKLKRGAYPTVTTIESDVKRMIQNAKDFNMPKSEVYEDAERMRKLVFNYMKVNNPAYKQDPSYSSFPTPIPINGVKASVDVNGLESAQKSASRSRKSIVPAVSEPPSERKSSAAPSATQQESDAEDDEKPGRDFTGKTFQEAQQMIISDLLTYTDDEGLEIFTPFINLPSRKLEDYYKIIRHPVSLKSVQKRIRGIHGRADPTGITDFKTWDALEDEVSFIWRNAREYNEDGSEMYEVAGEFEKYFKSRLAEAKTKVDEPASTRIKLGGAKSKSGITLNLSQHRSTPSVGIDNDALARQKQTVQNGVSVQQQANQSSSASPGTGLNAGDAVKDAATPVLPPPPVVSVDRRATQSPARTSAAPAGQLASSTTMPPPLSRLTSGSPKPPTAASSVLANGLSNGYHHAPTTTMLLPPTPLRTYPLADALLPLVTLSATPASNPPSAASAPAPTLIPIRPHPTLAVQSATVTLTAGPAPTLQITPTISRELALGRAYKIFVSLNATSLVQQGTQLHAASGQRTHTYEGRLVPGVNCVDVEIAAARRDGVSKGLEVEKVTAFVNVLR